MLVTYLTDIMLQKWRVSCMLSSLDAREAYASINKMPDAHAHEGEAYILTV